MPTIAVHLVTYNNADTLHPTLAALIAQDADFSAAVWDNASSDDSAAIAEQYGLDVVRSADNLGYAAAHNRLIARSDADYILTLNPDVVMQPGFLAQMATALDANPRAGSAVARLLRTDHIDGPPVGIDSAGLAMRRSRRQLLRGDGDPPDTPLPDLPIMGPDGAAAFYRRAMLDDIAIDGEIFDEDFFMHKEDVDVCWRAVLRGWDAVYVPDAVAHHVRTFRPGQRSRVNPYMRFLGVRNRYLLMLKNELPGGFAFDWPFILGYDAAVVGYMLLRERESLTALASAWRLRGKMLAKRRHIMAKRQRTWPDVRPFFRG